MLLHADILLQLATQVLKMENICVVLLDGNKAVTPMATGFLVPGLAYDPPGICHWSLVPSINQMIIVEDTLEDARQAE